MTEVKAVTFYLCATLHLCPLIFHPTSNKVKHCFPFLIFPANAGKTRLHSQIYLQLTKIISGHNVDGPLLRKTILANS